MSKHKYEVYTRRTHYRGDREGEGRKKNKIREVILQLYSINLYLEKLKVNQSMEDNQTL